MLTRFQITIGKFMLSNRIVHALLRRTVLDPKFGMGITQPRNSESEFVLTAYEDTFTFSGWYRATNAKNVMLLLNGAPIELSTIERPDVIREYPDAPIVIGFTRLLRREDLEARNNFTLLIGGLPYWNRTVILEETHDSGANRAQDKIDTLLQPDQGHADQSIRDAFFYPGLGAINDILSDPRAIDVICSNRKILRSIIRNPDEYRAIVDEVAQFGPMITEVINSAIGRKSLEEYFSSRCNPEEANELSQQLTLLLLENGVIERAISSDDQLFDSVNQLTSQRHE